MFEQHVRPLLVEQCQGCHGASRQSGGLRLDLRESVMKGGNSGALFVPGKPEGSRLLAAVKHLSGAPQMPPGRKLSDVQIGALEQWIAAGAPWPAARPAPARSANHWSFQPIRVAAPPRVRQAAWVKNPIDAFVLSRLEAQSLKPNPPADRVALIRRANYDLTGLPPTAEEVEAFVADRSPTAFEKVVDRLLASPHYGERWGRHWLDVARYADTNGLDENVHYGNAFRYRDWVVEAFNRDVPYNHFLQQQLAGDLLPAASDAEKRSNNIATGFLAIGPKVISEVDDMKMEMDAIDEQLDTMGRVTMGLTFGCARCHDHKFDPISQKDYYALAGIFKSTRFMETMSKPRMWFEHSLAGPEDQARLAEHTARVKAQEAEIARFTREATARLKASLPAGATLPSKPETSFNAEDKKQLAALKASLDQLKKAAPDIPGAIGLTEGKTMNLPIHIRGSFLNLGEMVPRGMPSVLASRIPTQMPADHSGRLELSRFVLADQNPLTARVAVNRVWRWHFGKGIVASTDNFGALGEKPSHPELLDWLAARFKTSADAGGLGWSLKALHRLVMLSNTYQMSSAHRPEAAAADPENKWLWRAPIRRLEAEEIRDSVLTSAGSLDRSMGGSLLPLKNREYVFDHTSKDLTKYDSTRRSLYLPVVRNHVYDFFQLFDFGDAAVPQGDRSTTTVAPQALFMMNSDLMIDAAERIGARLAERTELGDTERLKLMYRELLARPSNPREIDQGRRLLARLRTAAPGDANGPRLWGWAAQVLLMSNEFVTVR